MRFVGGRVSYLASLIKETWVEPHGKKSSRGTDPMRHKRDLAVTQRAMIPHMIQRSHQMPHSRIAEIAVPIGISGM